MVEAAPASYESITVIYNHRKGAEHHAEEIRERLQDTQDAPVNLLQTVKGGSEANAELFDAKLQPGTEIAVRGGEGTWRDTIGALLLEGMEELNGQVSVTSLNQRGKKDKNNKDEEAASNACDIGKSLHGRLDDPALIFGTGLRAVTAYALEGSVVTLTGDKSKGIAGSYIGFGHSALGSGRVNTDEYKKKNSLRRDLEIVAGTLLGKHTFTIIDQQGAEHTLSELSINKGEWMAKYARFDVRHWDEEFRVTPVTPGRLRATYTAVQLLFGNATGENRETPLHFRTSTPAYIHFDGEPPQKIPSWSTVHIGLHPRSYTVLTTKL